MMPSEAGRPDGAQQRMVRDYHRTTSDVGGPGGDYALLTIGLRRGLGQWLDVAGQRVLDLGCGKGELCWLALDAGAASAVGVNLSAGELSVAAQHVPGAVFVHRDILEQLRGMETGSVDRIFALNILEHLDKDTLAVVLEESRRCLAPDGTLTAMVPNAISPFGAMTRYWDFTHVLAFTPNSVRQLMHLCGFASVEFREWGPVPHGVVSTIRTLLWRCIRMATRVRLMIETGGDKGGIYTADMLFRLRASGRRGQ